MANSAMFFENFRNQILLSINTSMPCKVISYDEDKRLATIQPLFKIKETGRDPEALSVIEDVPVLWQRMRVHKKDFFEVSIPEGEHTHSGGGHAQYTGSGVHSHDGGKHTHEKMKITEDFIDLHPVLKAGDTVLAVFAQRAIDEAQDGKLAYPGSARIMSVHDAIIVGIF